MLGSAILAVGLATLVSCGDDGEPEPLVSRELDPNTPSFVHVHGLGLNPGDGLVYVATHNGLYRLEGGALELVGGRRWDVMGFTVRGPDHFIGGGHPSFSEIRDGSYPPNLGFVESRDGGETWEILAMRGETDLHALVVHEGDVYAVDAHEGQLLASPDGSNWERLAALPALSLAADGADGLLATTELGLVHSSDGGRTWAGVAGAPPLVLVTSHADGGVWGVDAAGTVYRRQSGGGWEQLGGLDGQSHALGSSADRVFAATDRGIYESVDGRTWTPLYRFGAE
jgi:hypothetical protein